ILAAEEIGLDVHLLDGEFARRDLSVNILMARIEAAGVTDHSDETRALTFPQYSLAFGQVVAEGNFYLHMLAGLQALNCLVCVHLGRSTEDHGVQPWLPERLGKVRGCMPHAIFCG